MRTVSHISWIGCFYDSSYLLVDNTYIDINGKDYIEAYPMSEEECANLGITGIHYDKL